MTERRSEHAMWEAWERVEALSPAALRDGCHPLLVALARALYWTVRTFPPDGLSSRGVNPLLDKLRDMTPEQIAFFDRLLDFERAQRPTDLAAIDHRLAAIEGHIATLTRQGAFTMDALSDLATQVSATTSAEQSAVVLLEGLSKRLSEAASDPAKVEALSAQLKASSDRLAAAILENTPAAPNAPPAPVDAPSP